jgi:hypothetical protein
MFDFEPYVSLLFSIVAVVVYSVIAWKISGESYSEAKFLRTIALAFFVALGFNISGTPLDSVYVSPFASTLTSALMSKFINKQRNKTSQSTILPEPN